MDYTEYYKWVQENTYFLIKHQHHKEIGQLVVGSHGKEKNSSVTPV